MKLKEQSDLSNTNILEKEVNKQNSSFIEREEIKDSPFMIISTEEGHFGVMAEYRITEIRNSKEEVMQELERITWNRIVQVIALVNEKLNNKK